jgi:predicted alpha/beta hydrolase family esterase
MIKDINIVVASGFFIDPRIWKKIFPQQSLICADNVRNESTSTLEKYAKNILDKIDFNKKTILIGHSYGCGLLTHVASILDGSNIKAFVMLNGIVPSKDETILEAYQNSKQSILTKLTHFNYNRGMLELTNKNNYLHYLFTPDKTSKSIALIKYENVNLLTSVITNILRSKNCHVIYVASENDGLTSINTQLLFAEQASADKTIFIKGGHLSTFYQAKQWVHYVQ